MSAINTGTALYAALPAHTVAVRANWADPWVAVNYLFCDWLETAANPELDRAAFSYRYGSGLQPGDNQYRLHTPLDLVGHYVRVSIPLASITWYGLLLDESDARDGAFILDRDNRIPSGRQSLAAVGLEYLLDRLLVRNSVVRGTQQERAAGTDEKFIPRVIPFNVGNESGSDVLRGNATPEENGAEVGEMGTKIFTNYFGPTGFEGAANPGTAPRDVAEWTSRDILEYLFAYKFQDSAISSAETPVPFTLSGQLDALEFFAPELDPTELSLRDILNRLCDRRRLLGWRLWVDDTVSPEAPTVSVFTFANQNLSIDATRTFPQNDTPVTLDFDRALDIELAEVGLSAGHRYDQVIVRGARRTTTCTLSAADGTLERDWTSDQETAYERAARDTAGYGALPNEDQISLNAAVRESDKLRRVFSWFRLPYSWDRMIDGYPLCPLIDDDGLITLDPSPMAEAYARALPRLPLLAGVDYSLDAIGLFELGLNDLNPVDSPPEFLQAFAMLRVATAPDRWILAEKLEVEKDYAFRTRVQEEVAGIVLECNQAGYQHALASVDFADLDPTDEAGDLDWNENLQATLCLVCDEHLEYIIPGNPAAETIRRLLIHVPDARLDWVLPGTVVALDETGQELTSDGGFVRDDRQRIEDLGRLAHDWYLNDRNTLRLGYRQVSGLFVPGQLITEIGAADTLQTVNTVVTRVRIDLERGSTQMETQFAELDVLAF